jgi:hypothetical protein
MTMYVVKAKPKEELMADLRQELLGQDIKA